MKSVLKLFVLIVITGYSYMQNKIFYNELLGRVANPQEFPGLVSVQYAQLNKGHICCGIIVSNHYVVSAASCYGYLPDDVIKDWLYIIIGGDSITPDGNMEQQMLHVKQIIVYPTYNYTPRHDIALLYIRKGIRYDGEFIKNMAIANEEVVVNTGSKCRTAGWAVSKRKHMDVYSKLMAFNLSIVDKSVCRCSDDSNDCYQQGLCVASMEDEMACFVLIRNVDDAPLCGGALVESRHVVSSAYCFTEKQNIEKLEIMAGEVTDSEHFGPTRQVRRVIRMMRHQSIGSHNGKFDILVLRLLQPFTRNVYLQPIPMAAFDLNMGSACSLVTWDKKFSKVGIHVVRYTTIFTKHQSGCAIKDKNIFCAGKESEVNGILVSLQLENGEGHFCGGTIINAKHIFTAAHCIVAHNKDDIENKMIIIAGDTRLKRNTTSSRQERYPELIILHSYFNEFTLEDDAAIIRITHRFQFNEFVHAVPLSKSKPGLGTVCVIAGWGVTSPNGKGPVSDKLLYAKVYVVEGDYCDYSPDYKFKPDKMICGGVLGGGTDVCTVLFKT
ncbi:unnamed protein product [Hermetia illucens]|uniref:Peptidase S1 domain-containing protein n=1 Tax=Hermetia illucens TaxID=343691 RepID=A0A7R8YW80_HERIL|nr:unnamed protein product [Hermetia illucens]